MRGLDDTDRTLLELLAADARRSYSDLADRVGLSGPAVSDRIERLRELGVIRRFTVDVDRSLLGGDTPILVDLQVRPGHARTVAASVREADAVEHVFTTVDARVVFTARVPRGDVDDLLGDVIDPDDLREYDVSLLAETTWEPHVGDATFAPECAECTNTVTDQGVTTRLDDDRYHFCCDSCAERFTERYEHHRAAADAA